MSTSDRFTAATFTTLPALFFTLLFLQTGWLGRDYWWETYLMVLSALTICSVLFGFAFPAVLQKLKLHQPWIWISISGLLAWIVALLMLGMLNTTPLCVGQNNGDGNNDLGMCMFMTALSGIIYTPVYLALLVASSLIGQWMLSLRTKYS